MSDNISLETAASKDEDPVAATDRVLPLRLDDETSARLATIAAVLGYSEGAAAKIAIRAAAEDIMGLVRRMMAETARDFVARSLKLPLGEDAVNAGPLTEAELEAVCRRAADLRLDVDQARQLLARRRYLKHLGPPRYRGDDSDRSHGLRLFDSRAPASVRAAVEDVQNEAADILVGEVKRQRRLWLNLEALRLRLFELEAKHLSRIVGDGSESEAQARALADLIARIESAGGITPTILAWAAEEKRFDGWVVAALSQPDGTDTQKIAYLKEQMPKLEARAAGIRRLKEQADEWLQSLQRSRVWTDANALAEMIEEREERLKRKSTPGV